jgi:hypothetical protein
MILLNAICKLFEVIAVGSVVTFVILFVSAWIRGEFKKWCPCGILTKRTNLKRVRIIYV